MYRRTFLLAGAATLGSPWLPRRVRGQGLAPRPVPTAVQLVWQHDELAMFCHFGVNTFTDREWGDGTEDPSIFAPTALDARQWARAARAAGFRAMILTAKHHDGFCLWPTRTTTHSVARSPWRAGGGDLVREFVDACRAEGLRPGLYLSPWDRNHPAYGDSGRYNDVYEDQLTELLANYGPQAEVWFDGANGEGPSGRRQQYDWPRVWATPTGRLSIRRPCHIPEPRAPASSRPFSTAIPTARCGVPPKPTCRSGAAGSITPIKTIGCGRPTTSPTCTSSRSAATRSCC